MPIPFKKLCFGTYGLKNDSGVNNIREALEEGYRHIDTAQGYENEDVVGEAIASSSVPRDDIFIATKVFSGNLSYENVINTVDNSCQRLGVDVIDLLYVHWPYEAYDPNDTLAAFEALAESDVIRNIGLSNFRVDQLEKARTILDSPVFAHQVECHPLLPQSKLKEYADRHDHLLVAYSPLAQGKVFDVPEMNEVADKYNCNAAQVSLAWLINRGICPIPKASGDHISQNAQAVALADDLTATDMEKINSIDQRHRVIDPDNAPWNTD